MRKILMALVGVAALGTFSTTGCKETDCEKLAAITQTCLSRYCSAGGSSTALCTCWEHDMVLAGWTAAPCNNGLDDDNDGFTDCSDPDCWASEACMCTDQEDNDDDGLTDCDDPDCAAAVACCTLHEKAPDCCSDGLDNDGDQLTDCEADPDCARTADCCSDGLDNDGDGLTDCDDAECALYCCSGDHVDELEGCNCNDGEDNDGNGLTDCQDDACWATLDCWDIRNSWHSEKVPYCVDAVETMDEACHSSRATELLKTFDCQVAALLYSAGLIGKYSVAGYTERVDLGSDGHVDQENSVDPAMVRGPKQGTVDDVDLSRITFFDDGWFSSNISAGVWEVRMSAGTPTGTISVSFLSDECLDALDICDPTRPLSWRRGPDGPMFYEFTAMPEASTVQLGQWELADVDSDGVDDLTVRLVQLERR